MDLVLHYGETPLANELLSEKKEQKTFPLNLTQCSSCGHLQIDCIVNKRHLYKNYLYCSDTSQSNRDYFQQYANEMIDRFHPKIVLDIASNDGLFLSYFKQQGITVIGVDPAENIAKQARANGIPTIAKFFNASISIGCKVDLITCNNMFAHNADLRPILIGASNLIDKDGIFVIEVSYARRMLEKGLLDIVYHEHIHHHHLMPLMKFTEKYGLKIFDAQEVPTHGGSIRIFLKKATPYQYVQKSQRLIDLLSLEKQYMQGLVDAFVTKAKALQEDLGRLLIELTTGGKSISILGYPAKATTLSSYFGLSSFITDVFDDNPLKVGKYTPGGHFKIRPTGEIAGAKPDYLLILAWNYANELMNRFAGSKFIVPIPEVKIYETTTEDSQK